MSQNAENRLLVGSAQNPQPSHLIPHPNFAALLQSIYKLSTIVEA